jgi:hypothetical protein
MAHEKIRAAIVFVTIFAIVGGVSWALVNAQRIPNQPDQPQTMPKLTIHEQIRDAAIANMAGNHPQTSQFMTILSWTGGRQDKNLLGAETYIYQTQGWKVTIHYPVDPNPIYSVTAEYSESVSGGIGIPYGVKWEGIWQNGTITETSFLLVQ